MMKPSTVCVIFLARNSTSESYDAILILVTRKADNSVAARAGDKFETNSDRNMIAVEVSLNLFER